MDNTDETVDGGWLPATRGEVLPDLGEVAEQLVVQARAEGVNLTGPGGVLTGLIRRVLETGLEAEMTEHVGHQHRGVSATGNHRNGRSRKTVTTHIGSVDIAVPRDRDGTFEPQTVPKHARRLEGLNAAVLSLYAKGLITGEIQAHLEEIYDTAISRDTISKITDAVVEQLAEWQTRSIR